MWSAACRDETSASPAAVFAVLGNPATWPEWNAGVGRVDLAGPSAAGTQAVMVLPDGGELPFRITWVQAGSGYADETLVPGSDVVVRVTHELAPSATGTRITFRVEADAPADVAAETGQAASADFPEVIAALGALAQLRADGRDEP